MPLPSTQALRALESFARHGSVWKAAVELNLTRSAVSHQLRLLERELGFALLQRHGRGVALTVRGRSYARRIGEALALIHVAGADGSGRKIAGSLSISCVSGLAAHWLCPRISEFQELWPEVGLRIQTPRTLTEVSNPDVDVFLAFGEGDWPGCIVELLSDVDYTPVCSPALAERLGGFQKPADLLRSQLLHLYDVESWKRWFAFAGEDPAACEAGIVFSDKVLVISAAIAGQGVTLGDEQTCHSALASGQLIRPFPLSIRNLGSYYLVIQPRKAQRPPVVAFRTWLRSRFQETAAGSPKLRPPNVKSSSLRRQGVVQT